MQNWPLLRTTNGGRVRRVYFKDLGNFLLHSLLYFSDLQSSTCGPVCLRGFSAEKGLKDSKELEESNGVHGFGLLGKGQFPHFTIFIST